MNLTTQELVNQFQLLSPNELPNVQTAIKQAFLLALKGIRDILLLYPVNIIILLFCLYWIIYKILSGFTNPKIKVYYPLQHVEAHDQHIKNLKKDIRQVQNQSLNLSRKMQARKNENKNKEIPKMTQQNPRSQLSQDLTNLLEQREYIKNVSRDSINQIKDSENRVLEKLRKYRR